jgi:hypothetical protein
MKIDKRFERVVRDPRFRRLPPNRTKVTIDERFRDMFTEEKFFTTRKWRFSRVCVCVCSMRLIDIKSNPSESVDKYGRELRPEKAVNELKRYYHLNDNHEEMLMSHTSSSESGEESLDVSEAESKLSSDDKGGAKEEGIGDTIDYAEVFVRSSFFHVKYMVDESSCFLQGYGGDPNWRGNS